MVTDQPSPRRWKTKVSVAFVALVLLISCGRDGPNRAVAGVAVDTATLVLEWAGARVAGAGLLAVGADGHVFVSDSTGAIHALSAHGEYVNTLEVLPEDLRRQVTGLAVTPAGVAFRDGLSGVVHLVDETGAALDEWRVSPGTVPWGAQALASAEGGRLWAGVTVGPGSHSASGGRPVYVSLERRGSLGDTLRLPPSLHEGCLEPDPRFASGWFEDFRVRYLPMVRWALSRDGTLVAGCPAAYTLHTAVGTDHPLELVRAGVRPVGVSEQERSDFEKTWTAFMTVESSAEPWAWTGHHLGETKPAYQELLPTLDGALWVWPAQPSRWVEANPTWPFAGLPAVVWLEGTSGAFDVFDARGTLRGHVRLPDDLPHSPFPDTPNLVVRGDSVWGVSIQADGSELVSKWTVDWP
jgi:hypothetical protein